MWWREHRHPAFFVASLLGCAPNDADVTPDASSGSSSSESGAACDVETRCGLPTICGLNGVTIGGVGGYGGELGVIGDWVCAFSALRDQIPGSLTLTFGYTGHPESSYRTDRFEILGDGTAINVGSYPFGPRVRIRSADYFVPCLESGDPAVCGERGLTWFEPYEGEVCGPLCCPFPTQENPGCAPADACPLERPCEGAVEIGSKCPAGEDCCVDDVDCCTDDRMYVGLGSECTFAALRDGTVGQHYLVVWDSGYTHFVQHIVYVDADRTAQVVRSISMPNEAPSFDTMRVTLKPPEFFESCLQAYAEGRACDLAQCGLHFYESGSCTDPSLCVEAQSHGPERPCE